MIRGFFIFNIQFSRVCSFSNDLKTKNIRTKTNGIRPRRRSDGRTSMRALRGFGVTRSRRRDNGTSLSGSVRPAKTAAAAAARFVRFVFWWWPASCGRAHLSPPPPPVQCRTRRRRRATRTVPPRRTGFSARPTHRRRRDLLLSSCVVSRGISDETFKKRLTFTLTVKRTGEKSFDRSGRVFVPSVYRFFSSHLGK